MELKSNVPPGPLEEKWSRHKFEMKLVSPANKRKYTVVVVGSGQTGQQLLLGAYQALERQVGLGAVEMHTRHEMQELVVVDGRARGIVARDLETGRLESHAADAVVLASGGYGTVFYLATYAKGC